MQVECAGVNNKTLEYNHRINIFIIGELMNICVDLILLEGFVCAYASIYNTALD